MRKMTRPFKHTRNLLLQDPETATLYLEEVLADGDAEFFKIALRHVAEAQLGNVSALAQKTKPGQENIYDALLDDGDLSLTALIKILKATGLKLSIHATG